MLTGSTSSDCSTIRLCALHAAYLPDDDRPRSEKHDSVNVVSLRNERLHILPGLEIGPVRSGVTDNVSTLPPGRSRDVFRHREPCT